MDRAWGSDEAAEEGVPDRGIQSLLERLQCKPRQRPHGREWQRYSHCAAVAILDRYPVSHRVLTRGKASGFWQCK